MGAQILTRIYNQSVNDYIDLHDRHWDGDINRVKRDLKVQKSYWAKFVDSLQEDIINSEYDFTNLMTWAENFENFLRIDNHFPCLEHSAVMLSMKSLNHFHILPHYSLESKQLLDFWGYEHPDLITVMKKHDFSFPTKEKKFILTPKAVDKKEFKIVRILTRNDYGREIFVDVKVREFNRKDFLFSVLSLPEFWRNFHFVSRKRKEKGAIVHPAYSFNKSLMAFYTPSNKFIISSTIGKNKKEIFNNVKAESPLSLYVNSMAMHLFFSMPNLVLPLTAREQLWSGMNEPEMTITINNNEVNLLTVDYSKNNEENRSALQEFSEKFSEREQSFAQFFELGQYSGGQYLLTTGDEFAFVYETNMIELFDSMTKIDQHART